MGFWNTLDPTSDNFFGMGPKWGRIFAGINSAGGTEFHRTDPMATTPGTTWNQVGRGFGGAGPGAVGGYAAGGPYGAVAGGIGGGILGGTGKTNSTTPSGWGEDLGAGFGLGKLMAMTYGGGAGNLAKGGGAGGASGGGSAAGGGAAGGAAGGSQSSPIMNMLMASRGMGGEQQQEPEKTPQERLEKLYAMYPSLRPHTGGRYYGA